MKAIEYKLEYIMRILLEQLEFDCIGGPSFEHEIDNRSRNEIERGVRGVTNFAQANLCHLNGSPRDLYEELRDAFVLMQTGIQRGLEHPEDAQR
jgi:hypothetical protein